MNAPRPWPTLAAAALLWCGIAVAADPRFGELPRGAMGTAQTHGVAAEICREYVFDPDAAGITLPPGYRLQRASEAARKNPALTSLIRRHPPVSHHALGVLCVISADRWVIEDSPDQTVSPAVAAFWWASAEGPRHPDMRGPAQWIQLGSWYPATTPNRDAVRRADPMAEFVDLAMVQQEPNRWTLRLALPNDVIVADIRTSGTRVPSAATQPAHMSVPMSGRHAGTFTVYTYSGHAHRLAEGTWRATGTGVISSALGLAGESEVFDTVFQEGWVSRSGLYSMTPP